jgi:peptidase MA superfamily protein
MNAHSTPVPKTHFQPHGVIVSALLIGMMSTAFAQTAAEFNRSGVELYNRGRWQESIDAFLDAYNLAPDNTTVRRNLCNAYQASANRSAREGRFDDAVNALQLAVAVDPENPSPLVQLGSYYLRLDYVSDAVFRLEEAIELAPENVDAHDLLGDAYYKDNDVPSAIAQWEWVGELQPDRTGMKSKLEKALREDAVEYDFRRERSRHFQASFDPGVSARDLNLVLTVLERAYRDIGRKMGGAYPPAPIHVNVYMRDGFEQATNLGSHVGAVYDGKIRIPLKDSQTGQALEPKEIERRLYHEYVHVVVRFLVGDNAPWWFNEGLAMTLTEEGLSDEHATLLRRSAQQRTLVPLRQLEQSLTSEVGEQEIREMYAQMHAATRYLVQTFGIRNALDMLGQLAEGKEAEEALVASFHRNYELLESELTNAIANGRI